MMIVIEMASLLLANTINIWQYDETVAQLQRALRIYENAFGVDHIKQ